MDDEVRYSISQISLATGITEPRLQQMRKSAGVAWRSKGYTAREVVDMIGNAKLRPAYAMQFCRSRKAKELWERLGGAE